MEIFFNSRKGVRFDLTIKTEGGTTTEVDITNPSNGVYIIDESLRQNFITIANEMSRFNGISDVDFAKEIIENFLTDTEKQELIQHLTTNNH